MIRISLLIIALSAIVFAAPVEKRNAVSIVAKTNGKGFSEQTKKDFISSCVDGVEEPICQCVLKKLESKYDEGTFKKLENDLAVGNDDPAYVNFIVNSTVECESALVGSLENQQKTVSQTPQNDFLGGIGAGGFQLSGDDMMLLMALLQSPLFKDSFVQSCTVESMEWLGTNQADKTCKCAFDRLVKDNTLVSRLLSEGAANGNMSDFNEWGYGLVEPCLPKEFPAEMDNAFIKECMKSAGANKATCECVASGIKKDYNVRSLIKLAFEEPKKLELDLAVKAAQCLSK